MRDGKVHLVDDDDAVRDSAAFLLECADCQVVTYDHPVKVLDALRGGIKMSCLITDVRMPDIDGLELVRRSLVMDPGLPIIIITGHGDVPLAVQAMKSGAADFLEKPFNDQTLITTVRAIMALRSEPSQGWVEIRKKLDLLSSREREVLQGLVDGHPNKVIAHHLGISPRTVEVYRAKAMTKMGAGSFAELVRMAMVADLVFAPALIQQRSDI